MEGGTGIMVALIGVVTALTVTGLMIRWFDPNIYDTNN